MKTEIENVTLCCPSYRRAGDVITHRYLPDLVYFVDINEADEYSKAHDRIFPIPKGVQGRLTRVYNWILDNVETDHIIFIDDDMKVLRRWVECKERKLSTDEAMEFIESCIDLVEQIDVRYWGLQCVSDKGSYREYTPFSTTSYIGGPFQGHYKNPLRYDEAMLLKEDYDMTLQATNVFRKVLRFNFAHYICAQHTNKGGCAAYRTTKKEIEQNNALRRKWGEKIVKRDGGEGRTHRKKEQRKEDINPIIKVPIAGV